MSEIEQSAAKAQEAAQRTEQARECKAAEDHVTRFKRAWEGPSNSGTAKVTGEVVIVTQGQRLLQAVGRAVLKSRAAERRATEDDVLTPATRRRRAAEYRALAAELERA